MNCRNCNVEIKSGFIKSNNILNNESIETINNTLNLIADTYCNSCGDELLRKAEQLIKQKKDDNLKNIAGYRSELSTREYHLNKRLNEIIKYIPVLTEHSPYKWEYTSIELVSGQTVAGTGLISEVISDFTDFFWSKI